jgi:uncharacterized protein GlcG (DUF336 family)
VSTVKTQFATRRTLSAEQSRALVDAAASGARSAGIAVTIVVVDEAGVTKEMLRMDGAPLDTVRTAANKAYAAASLGVPSDDFFKDVESEPAAMHEFCTRDDLSLIGGGVPVLADGDVAGAIGISGADTAEEDRRIAEAAIASAVG